MRARPIPTAALTPHTRERFMRKVEVDPRTGCWMWTGGKRGKGYGKFWLRDASFSAHRVSYALFAGEPDVSLTIDHLCRNRRCVNPAHLEQVTIRENVLRGYAATGLCKAGLHELTEANTFWFPSRPFRNCLQCARDTGKRSRDKCRALSRRQGDLPLAEGASDGLGNGGTPASSLTNQGERPLHRRAGSAEQGGSNERAHEGRRRGRDAAAQAGAGDPDDRGRGRDAGGAAGRRGRGRDAEARMTWDERVTVLVILAVFLCGYGVGWSGRVSARRSRRLVERLGRERTPW